MAEEEEGKLGEKRMRGMGEREKVVGVREKEGEGDGGGTELEVRNGEKVGEGD